MQKFRWVIAGLALPLMTSWAHAGELTANQALANRLAQEYRTSGRLSAYSVDIEAIDGKVSLSGSVSSQAQLDALLEMTRQCPGVADVTSDVQIESIRPVAFQPGDAPRPLPTDAAAKPAPGPNGVVVEPAPITNYTGGIAPYADAPVMPPYSWPAYTPYNNFASMAYQTQYPSGAWPFIGPPHPYPMIPSGWRRTTLKWKGGYWWLKFHAH